MYTAVTMLVTAVFLASFYISGGNRCYLLTLNQNSMSKSLWEKPVMARSAINLIHNTPGPIPPVNFILHMLRPYWAYLGGFFACSIFWAIDFTVRPYLVKVILDRLASTNPADAVANVSMPLGAYWGMCLIMMLSYRLHDFLYLTMIPALKQRIILYLSQHLLGQSYHYFQTHFAGDLATKIRDVSKGTSELTINVVERFFHSFLALSIAITTLMILHWQLGCILFSWVVLYCIISLLVSKAVVQKAERYSHASSRVVGRIVDMLANMVTVRLFNAANYERDKLEKRTDDVVNKERAVHWLLFSIWFFQGVSFLLVLFGCGLFLLFGFRDGRVTVGDFGLLFSIIYNIIDALWNLAKDIGKTSEYAGLVAQGLRVITVPQGILDVENASNLEVERGEIRFEKVCFAYKQSQEFFKNMSVTIPAGQKVGLVGYSGSGKTTFVNLILRFFDVQSGSILIDDQNIAQVTQESLRANIGMIPQDPVLFHRSLIENIRYGRLNATDSEVVQAAERAYAHEFITHLSEGYKTLAGERGVKISGGQRQRIAIARAILKNAPILILDEATSALDSQTEQLIQESFTELMVDKTTLVIAHRLSTLLNMDRILVFDRGAIVEDGNHKELLAKDGMYKRLWGAQVGGFLPKGNGFGGAEEEEEV